MIGGINDQSASSRSIRPSMKQGGTDDTVAQGVTQFFYKLPEFFFPTRVRAHHQSIIQSPVPSHSSDQANHRVLSVAECKAKHEQEAVQVSLDLVKNKHGKEGLHSLEFEYRLLPCEHHTKEMGLEIIDVEETIYVEQSELVTADEPIYSKESQTKGTTQQQLASTNGNTTIIELDPCIALPPASHLSPSPLASDFLSTDATTSSCAPSEACADLDQQPYDDCPLCMHRLYHRDVLINDDNRKQYISDGPMYEEMARLCQEYAQDCMCEHANLEWATIQDGCEPIRAMVNSNHSVFLKSDSDMRDRPTVLIATGKGKVRAGIFSRQHLMCSGLESATALPIVRQAVKRRLNMIIVDPNAHGDAMGFATFVKTMEHFKYIFRGTDAVSTNDESFARTEGLCAAQDLYVLSHSASGGHLVRYLLDKTDHYLPNIRAIAFTDSTHNFQWAKNHGNIDLHNLLESPKCVYFRSSQSRQEMDSNSHWYLHSPGEPIRTDTYWQHRFGKIKTFWAGTNEHSLTNWFAHDKIWQHFDDHLRDDAEDKERNS
jgi:hypothetical protein